MYDYDKYAKLADWYMNNPDVLEKYPNATLYAKSLNKKLKDSAMDLIPTPEDNYPYTQEDWDLANIANQKAIDFNNFYNNNINTTDYIEDTSYNNLSELNDLFDDFGDTSPQTGGIADAFLDDGTINWIPGLNRQQHYVPKHSSAAAVSVADYLNSRLTPISKFELSQQPSHILRKLYSILQNKE